MPTMKIINPLPEIPRYKNVGIYCRVSSTHADQLASLSQQVSYFTKMVMARGGWWLSDIYLDIKSAETGSHRPEYERLLRDCRDKKLDLVITKSISRFGRDTLELLTTIRELRDIGICVMFEQEQLSTESAESEHIITIIE